jgi:mono/diheme cytochrome c family protein
MMRPAYACCTALVVFGVLSGCRGAPREEPEGEARPGTAAGVSRAETAQAADVRAVMGMSVTEWRRRRVQAPVVAPVAAKKTGVCPVIDTSLVDEGREVFQREGGCYACHGPDARGSGVAPGLTGSVWLDIDGSYPAIARVVQDGVIQPSRFPSPMPPKGGAKLDGEQVCAVAAYVFSLSH